MGKFRTETVTRVIDDDTFLTKERRRSIRLANISACEKGTKRGRKATEQLRDLIEGKKVRIMTIRTDLMGRSIAIVRIGNRSVNNIMVRKLKK